MPPPSGSTPSPALSAVLTLLRQHQGNLVETVTSRILENIPKYALADPVHLRLSVETFVADMLDMLNLGRTGVMERILKVAAQRVSQGFSLSDYLRALLISLPAARAVVRQSGQEDSPLLRQGFSELEAFLTDWVAHAANVFLETTARQLDQKNAELNRVNQRLLVHERSLSLEVEETQKALSRANEFNQRVIESLSSGIMVTDPDARVVLYSSRMEQMLGLPSEEVLGRPVLEALQGVTGIDAAELIGAVRMLGRVPLTKVRVTLPTGRKLTVHLQAHQVRDEFGQSQGTVVVVDDVSERELLIDSFSRYVSRDLVNRLLARSEPLGLGGERRMVTVLFADIRGFTSLAEGLPPEELHQVLNEYLRVMIDALIAHGGFIDKFVGDKVMALFLGSSGPADAAHSACRAALAIKRRIKEVSAVREATGKNPIDVGIGINTGEVLLGNVGSEDRMDFTAIGDAVNVADRMQSLARQGEILLGQGTAVLLDGRFALLDKGSQTVKGRRTPVHVHELVVV